MSVAVANVGYTPVSPMPVAETRVQPVKQEVKEKTQQETSSPKSQPMDLEKVGRAFNRKLQFEIDHSSNEVLVKVIDKETDKVIKVIPPEELQRLHRNLKEAIGLLLNEMV